MGLITLCYSSVMKNFDNWNIQKKEIDGNDQEKLYRPRQVWWCSLGVNVGFEQDGTGTEYQRPILVLRGFSKHVCLVVPLTTSLKKNPYHISAGIIDGKQAFAIISQVRLIDTKRLIKQMVLLDIPVFDTIKKAAKDLL